MVFVVVRGAERSMRISDTLRRLQDTTAQIRVRGAVVLLIAFAALAESLGLEVILGAFAAGAVLTLVDRDEFMTHPQFRHKLEAVGFGVFIPVFFVTSGLRFDLDALRRPVQPGDGPDLPAALLAVVRGLPALLYRPLIGDRRAVAAGLLQATSLPFIVTATAIGVELDLIGGAEAAALIAAGLLSVLLFPVTGLSLLQRIQPAGCRVGRVAALQRRARPGDLDQQRGAHRAAEVAQRRGSTAGGRSETNRWGIIAASIRRT